MLPPLAALFLAVSLAVARSARVGVAEQGAGDHAAAEVAKALPPAQLPGLPVALVRDLLSFLPRPPWIAWASSGEVRLLRPGLAESARVLAGHGSDVREVRFFPQADRVLTTDGVGRSVVWDVWSGQALQALCEDGLQVKVHETQVFPDGERVVALATDGVARIWSAAAGALLRRIRVAAAPGHRAVRVLLGGRAMATGVSAIFGEPARVWDVDDGSGIFQLGSPVFFVSVMEASPCGTLVVTGGIDGVFLWSAATGAMRWLLPQSHLDVYQVGLAGGGAPVLLSDVRTMHAADSRDGRIRWRADLDGEPLRFAWLPGGDRIITFTDSRAVVWDAARGQQVLSLEGVDGLFYWGTVRIAASSSFVAACGRRPANLAGRTWTAVWDASTGRRVHLAAAPRTGARGGSCSIAMGSSDGWTM